MTTSLNKVHALKPSVFYGNGLSRTWVPQFNSFRVEPTGSVRVEPTRSVLLWDFDRSTSGLPVHHTRYQRRTKGNFNKLRSYSTPVKSESGSSERKKKSFDYDSAPNSPLALKRKRFLDLKDGVNGSGFGSVANIIRNLADDFEEVAGGNTQPLELESAGKGLKEKKMESTGKGLKEKKSTKRARETSSTKRSPSKRLAKRRSCMLPSASSKISL